MIEVFSKDDCQIISDFEALQQWIAAIRAVNIFAIDIETDVLDAISANLVGICFAIHPGKVAYLPVGHDYINVPDQLDRATVLLVLKSILEDASIKKIGKNLKFDKGILKKYDIELAGIAFDTTVESYVLNTRSSQHCKIVQVDRFLQCNTMIFKEIVGSRCKQLKFNKITLEKAAQYVATKINATLYLHYTLWPQIEKKPNLKKIFQEIEMPLVPVLSRIECTGVLIDTNMLAAYSAKLAKRLLKLKLKVHQLAKEPFNLLSTQQLQVILYEKQKLPILKKTSRGVPSTSEEVLAKLALDYPLPRLILEYRSLTKFISTYINKLIKTINPVSKRIHTSYNQTVTITGRLSSSNPNLQNIPIRNKEGRRIRQAFIAPQNALILAADYSQIELRIIAHLSRDPALLSAFFTGKDIHSATAAEIFDIPLNKVTQNQRRSAKAINFGLIYGMSAFGLARQLSVPLSEAQIYMNLYFERYPGVLKYIERTIRQANDQGFVSTLDGRQIYLPDIRSCNRIRKKGAERTAINAPIQGTAANIIKRAMIAIDSWLQQKTLPVRMIMQIHDELVFEVQKDLVEIATLQIKKIMEECFILDVPLQVNIEVGKNWDLSH